MSEEIAFVVLGEPKGKARPRVVGGHAYTPSKTVEYENAIRAEYISKFGKDIRFEAGTPITVTISAFFAVPESASKRATKKMLDGDIAPTKKPDLDNLAKAVLDALNGIAYQDDAQITMLVVSKTYSRVPKVLIRIYKEENS